METKKMNLEEMAMIEGGWYACAASIAGAGLFLAGLFVVPVGGPALALYAANAILGPTVAGVGIVSSCRE